jgi:flagellar hook assembly protein FlgD
MRTRSSVQFNTGDSVVGRRYTITAAQGAVNGPVRISNLVVANPTRAAGSNVIGFTLSGDATYTVNIMTAAGRPVGTVATRAAAAGDVHLVWNGKDSSGKSVPAGTYIVQVRATGPDSDTVKAIVPFVVIR